MSAETLRDQAAGIIVMEYYTTMMKCHQKKGIKLNHLEKNQIKQHIMHHETYAIEKTIKLYCNKY